MATARTQPIRPESREQAIARSTMLLLLGAEGVFFLTLVMVALYLRTNELHSQFAAFRPSLLLPVTNTVVLGCSAFTMWWAHRSVGHDRTTMLRRLPEAVPPSSPLSAGQRTWRSSISARMA